MKKDIDSLIKKYGLVDDRKAMYDLKQKFIQIYAYESWVEESEVLNRLEVWLLNYLKLNKKSYNN